MDRVTARYAEQQVARLARELGCEMHYTQQLKGVDVSEFEHRGMAVAAPYGQVGAWVLDKGANNYLTVYAYANEQGGLTYPLGHSYFKPQELWDAAAFAMAVLRFQREQVPA